MTFTRRQALLNTMFGAGMVGLRALATGLPAAFFMNPRKALAGACANPPKAQYVIFSTSAGGDPINAGAPGTYADPNIIHSTVAGMAPKALTLAGKSYTAAGPWSTLPQNVLDRTVFWHLMTNTPIHPKEPDVLKLMGATADREMLPSLIAKATAPCLNTIQAQPVSVGGIGPSESLAYNGSVMPTIPPLALKDTLISAAGPLTNLQAIRDQAMNQVYAIYRTSATAAQKAFIDNSVNTQTEVRSLNQSLLSTLSSIADNTGPSQITAAITMIQMNIAPVIAIHLPFGGDNHSDAGLLDEGNQTITSLSWIQTMMQQLQTAGLQDKVSFMTLNVFGRTLMTNGGQTAMTGRAHNPNHQVSVTIGAPFTGGVIGSCVPVANDYGASDFSAETGVGAAGSDVAAVDSLGAYAQTMLQAVGGDPTVVSRGKVVTAAL